MLHTMYNLVCNLAATICMLDLIVVTLHTLYNLVATSRAASRRCSRGLAINRPFLQTYSIARH